MDGWIKIHRKILEWDHAKDPNKFIVFIHLILRANIEDDEFCRRGQVILSVRKFAEEIGLTYQTVRTVMSSLVKSNELTQEPTQQLTQGSTHRLTLVTICKFDTYQNEKARSNARTNARVNARTNAETKEKEISPPYISSPPNPHNSVNPLLKEKEKEKEELKENEKSFDFSQKQSGDCLSAPKTDIVEAEEIVQTSTVVTEYGFEIDSRFKETFDTWLEYKKSRKEGYKCARSVKACYNNLVMLSGGNPYIAQLVVEQSMANNWKGLFQLKKENLDTITKTKIEHEQRNAARLAERQLRIDDLKRFQAENESRRDTSPSLFGDY